SVPTANISPYGSGPDLASYGRHKIHHTSLPTISIVLVSTIQPNTLLSSTPPDKPTWPIRHGLILLQILLTHCQKQSLSSRPAHGYYQHTSITMHYNPI